MILPICVKRAYKPYIESESESVLLKTRKPATIQDGCLVGTQIDLYDKDTFRVWTNRKKKARALALKHHLKVRLLDGEAELFIPASLADELLPLFGAKVPKTCNMSPEQRKAVADRFLKARLDRQNKARKGLPAISDPKMQGSPSGGSKCP